VQQEVGAKDDWRKEATDWGLDPDDLVNTAAGKAKPPHDE
jgi:hypothetical protein